MVDVKKGAEFISLILIAAITVGIVVQVFLTTTPTIVESSATNDFNASGGADEDAGQLQNLSVTGKTVASFIPLLYIVLPLAFVGGVAAVLVLVGRKLFK